MEYEIKQMSEPTDEELLAEAQAWGFSTVDEFIQAMDEALNEVNQE